MEEEDSDSYINKQAFKELVRRTQRDFVDQINALYNVFNPIYILGTSLIV